MNALSSLMELDEEETSEEWTSEEDSSYEESTERFEPDLRQQRYPEYSYRRY